MRREQHVLPHQAQHALSRDAQAIEDAQARPDLAVPFARPGRAREIGPDRGEESGVGDRGLRSAPAARPLRPLLGGGRTRTA
jgi:hypothetical protein